MVWKLHCLQLKNEQHVYLYENFDLLSPENFKGHFSIQTFRKEIKQAKIYQTRRVARTLEKKC